MNKLFALLIVAVLFLCGLCALQRKELAAREAELARLNTELQEKANQAKALEEAREKAERQKSDLVRATEDLAQQVQQLQLAAAKPQPTSSLEDPLPPKSAPAPSGLGGFLSKMMSDPETKRLIRNQQRAMMDQLYNPLIKQLGLTSEQGDGFKDLLADNLVKSAEKATSLFGNMSATNRSELASAIAAEQKSSDEQMKTFLGEERFAIYKDYQETAGERMQLNAFRQQNDAGEYPLNDLQAEQLLAFMKDEKRNTVAALGAASSGGAPTSMERMLSEEQSDRLFSAQETANQHVFDNARTVLSPDQLRVFGTFQTNQLQMMRAGMSMARKLMTPQ